MLSDGLGGRERISVGVRASKAFREARGLSARIGLLTHQQSLLVPP